MEKETLGERLRAAGLIDAAQLRLAVLEQHRHGSVAESLVRLGFLHEVELVRAVCRISQTPSIEIASKRIEPEVLALVSADAAHKHRCLPLFVSSGPSRRVLFLGVEDPTAPDGLDEIARATGREVRPVVVGPIQLTLALERFYPSSLLGDAAGLRAAAPGDAEPEAGHEVPTRVILQALTKLLAAQGVIDRAELVAEIERLQADARD